MAKRVPPAYRLITPFGIIFYASKREAWAALLKMCIRRTPAKPAVVGAYRCEFIPSGAVEFSMAVG